MSQIRLALQLYTVRDHIKEDYAGTLRAVKEIGYDFVEALPGPDSGEEMRRMYDDAGLSIVGMHVALNLLEGDLDRWIGYAKAVGGADLVCPWLPENRRKTREDWLATAAVLEGLGARCTEAGLRLAYHNHNFEFTRFDGKYALDLLYENTTPENVCCELDTYWIKHGGADPAEYIRKLAGRGPLLHIKDMAADENRSFAEVGRGILDWPGIREAALESGVECCVVEQDRCAGDSFDSARISCEFATGLLAGR
jgi:sugar phosphate isomerase/epimerase